jgi:hypothetical protein
VQLKQPSTSIREDKKRLEKGNARENDMRNWLAGLMLLIAPPAFAQQPVPTIAFDSVPNPLKLPANMYFGEASGVSVNSKGHIFVLSRGNTSGPAYAAAATQLLEFDAQAGRDRGAALSAQRLARVAALYRT